MERYLTFSDVHLNRAHNPVERPWGRRKAKREKLEDENSQIFAPAYDKREIAVEIPVKQDAVECILDIRCAAPEMGAYGKGYGLHRFHFELWDLEA